MKNSFILNLKVVVFGFIISLFLAEIFLRIIVPKIDAGKQVFKKESVIILENNLLKYSPVPNKFGHDKNGFKNYNVLDSYDIVVLGDSHTYGTFNGDDNISWPIYLSEQTGKSIYNMGVWGYGVAQYYYLLDKALSFEPKTIIIGLYLGNDIYNTYDVIYNNDAWENFRSPEFINDNPTTVASHGEADVKFLGLRDFIRDKVFLYKFLSDRTRVWREQLGLAEPFYTGTTDWSYVNPDASLIYKDNKNIRTLFRNGERLRGVDLLDKNTREGLNLSLKLLGDINERAKKKNVNILIAFIPTKQSAYLKELGDKAKQNSLFNSIIENERETKKILFSFCQDENIACIDILPGIQDALSEGKKVYPDSIDDHPTSLGYKEYANIISNYEPFK